MRALTLSGLVLMLLLARSAGAEEIDARGWFERAQAMFALQKYAEAADAFERAFELKPNPAILYNAAQAHRLAQRKERALALYSNYLRIYGAQISNRAEVQNHINTLKRALDAERAAVNSPPMTTVTTAPSSGGGVTSTTPTTSPRVTAPEPRTTAPPPPLEPRAPAATSATNGNSTPARNTAVVITRPVDTRPVTKKPWFWAVIGVSAAVVVGVGVGVGVTVGSKTVNPPVTFGAVNAN